jgi:hypothetical protein
MPALDAARVRLMLEPDADAVLQAFESLYQIYFRWRAAHAVRLLGGTSASLVDELIGAVEQLEESVAKLRQLARDSLTMLEPHAQSLPIARSPRDAIGS